jgi:eukaryotic-like serine/threonine-protein kinase
MTGSGNNIFEQMQSICDRFRRQLKRGAHARIEDYLGQLDDAAEGALFQNLLQLDMEFRRRNGETPTSEDYIQRFPQFADQVRQTFFESHTMSHDSQQASSGFEETVLSGMPASRRLGEYALLGELGRGAFGVVYEARHNRRNDRVALKTLPTNLDGQSHPLRDADRLHRFRREFRSLAEINHPHLVGMQTLEFDAEQNQWFFTMDLVDGRDFLSHVRPNGELNEKRLRAALPQLVTGISALHAQHIVHRDLKPSNVMVDSTGHVVILDFGLVAELQDRLGETVSMRSGQFAGTLPYAAPEQLSGQRPAAADWYAMGVMIYEALTGERPFSGSPTDLIVQKQTLDAPTLLSRDDLPTDLTALVDQLLKRKPEERPTATAIASSLSVEQQPESADSVEGDMLSAQPAPELSLIGREEQLAQLEAIRREWMAGDQPVVVFISGRSGEGKTSLIEKFLAPFRKESPLSPARRIKGTGLFFRNGPKGASQKRAPSPLFLILSGRCYDRESVPYKAIDGLIDALVGHLRSQNDDEVAEMLPEDTDMLAQLFPVTRRVAAIAKLDLTLVKRLDAKQVRFRAFHALKELLARISHESPLVMFIDDLQWGDADSASVLMRLLSPPEAPTVLMLGSFRSDEANDSVFLTRWNSLKKQADSHWEGEAPAEPGLVHHVASLKPNGGENAARREPRPPYTDSPFRLHDIIVGPLPEAQCVQLVLARVGDDSPTLRDRAAEIHESTGGNPYLIDQLIECLDRESGALTAVPLNQVIGRRLSRLPKDAAALLDVIAISGHAISATEVSEAAGLSGAAFATLNRMRNERLVRLIGSDRHTQVDTYHDKIREAVLVQLGDHQRQELHRAVGETIERLEQVSVDNLLASITSDSEKERTKIDTPARVYDLAYHFHAADDAPRTLVYSVLAAEAATQQFAFEVAAQYFEIAEANAMSASNPVRYRIRAGYGRSLTQLGRYDEALSEFGQAAELSDDLLETAEAQSAAAEIHQRRGELQASTAVYRDVLRKLGVSVPQSSLGFVREWVWNGFCLLIVRFNPFHGHRKPDAKELFIARILGQGLYLACAWTNTLHLMWSLSAAIRRNRQFRDPYFSIRANIFSANQWLLVGRYQHGWRKYTEQIGHVQESNDMAIFVTQKRSGGYMQISNGRFHEAEATLAEVEEHAKEKMPDFYSLQTARCWRAYVLLHVGELAECTKISRMVFDSSVSAGHDRFAGMALECLERATAGRLPFARLRDTLPQATDNHTMTVQLLTAEADWHLVHGRTDQALDKASNALDIVHTNLLTNAFSMIAFPVFMKSAREHARSLQESQPRESQRLLRRSIRAGRWGVRISRCVKTHAAATHRELALTWDALGRTRKAIKYARKSCRIAKQQDASYEYAKSLLVCGQLAEKLGRPEARQQIEEAEVKLRDFDRQIEAANQQMPVSIPSDSRTMGDQKPILPSPPSRGRVSG